VHQRCSEGSADHHKGCLRHATDVTLRVLGGGYVEIDRMGRVLHYSMEIRIESRHLQDVVVIVPDIFQDGRGFFTETFRVDQFHALGLPTEFVQDNHSRSVKGVVRGLHFQWDPPMSKLMRVTAGSAFLVAVDIRKGSPTLGQWVGVQASTENRRQVYAPAGFARGFCALSDSTEIQYKCTGIYNAKAESAIRWNDPEIGIKWPLEEVIVSEKDRKARTLAEWLAMPESGNFRYVPELEKKKSTRSSL
jgi:dTDP-4-dehydrorhamnose 3,5-epimerase